MVDVRSSPILRTIPFLIAVCLITFPVQAKYSGGSGTAADPYQIATAADLIALGETPADYDKHFILTADIDLDPNLPGRKVFDRAVIAPDVNDTQGGFQGTSFTGVFDGKGRTISRLTIKGGWALGLFGQLVDTAEVRDLGVVDVNITGSGDCVGGLAGSNSGTVTYCHSTGVVSGVYSLGGLVGCSSGTVTQCYATGAVSGVGVVGGLVGSNDRNVTACYSTGAVSGVGGVGGLAGYNQGAVTRCHSTGVVSGRDYVGGLVGSNGESDKPDGIVTQCYSTGAVKGSGQSVGGLVGDNEGTVTQCYSTGAVSAGAFVGGLVGSNGRAVTQCYSTGAVKGSGQSVGGLVGAADDANNVSGCFWDTQTSGQTTSAGGTGETTTQMRNMQTYLDAGWDFVGETWNGTSEIWQMAKGGGYPVLGILEGYTPPQLQGRGTAEEPYLIRDAMGLGAMVYYDPYAHYRLAAPLDLSGIRWGTAVIPWFGGTFDGNHLTILGLTIQGGSYLGLFGRLANGAEIKDLGVVDVNITGSGNYVGGLVGGIGSVTMTRCYSAGTVRGGDCVGGLVGLNGRVTTDGTRGGGTITECYSTGAISGTGWGVGGLVGSNGGHLTQCYSAGAVSGNSRVGGLVGDNDRAVTQCYSTGAVNGTGWSVGGLVGYNQGTVTECYSESPVSGIDHVGGLVAWNNLGPLGPRGYVSASFWDTQTSGQAESADGTGKTTAQMQTAKTFLDAGWDFVGETKNGTEDIWWILEGKDYPRLWWEARN
jgi:hypothetical protein